MNPLPWTPEMEYMMLKGGFWYKQFPDRPSKLF